MLPSQSSLEKSKKKRLEYQVTGKLNLDKFLEVQKKHKEIVEQSQKCVEIDFSLQFEEIVDEYRQ